MNRILLVITLAILQGGIISAMHPQAISLSAREQENLGYLIEAVKAGQHIKVEAALEAGAPANAIVDGLPLVVLAARHVNAQDPDRNEYHRITARLLKRGGAKGFTAQGLINQIPNADTELQKLIRKFVK